MGTTSNTRRPRRTWRLALEAVTLFATTLTMVAGPVSAAPSTLPGSSFEIDGNKAGANDWAGIGGVTVINDMNSTNVGMTPDSAQNQNCDNNAPENIAVNNAKIDQNPWGGASNSAPAKADLCQTYFKAENSGGDTFLYLGWTRYSSVGTAVVYFELSQGGNLAAPGSPLIDRTDGDLLVAFDFQGGTPSATTVWRWNEAHSRWEDKSGNQTGDALDGTTALAAISDDQLFGELAINLTKAELIPGDNDPCGGFGYVTNFTQTGNSFASSTIQDYANPAPVNVSNCGRVSVDKMTVPADAPDLFDFSLTRATPGFQEQDFQLADQSPRYTTLVHNGTYAVTEADHDDWHQTGAACFNARNNATATPDAVTVSSPFDDWTCVFTNEADPANITLVKHIVDPAGSPDTFDLLANDDVVVADAGDGSSGTGQVPSGDVTVSETGAHLSDYSASVSCLREDENTAFATADASKLKFTTDPGDDVTCTFTNTRRPADLTITKSPAQGYVLPGGTATFSMTVSNAAAAATARNVVVHDALPAGVTYVSSQDNRCDPDGTTCAIGTLAPGASVTFTITYQVPADSQLDVVHNEASVTSTDDPESPGAEADIPVAALAITKAVTSEGPYDLGDKISYEITVWNANTADLTNVTVSDPNADAFDQATACAPAAPVAVLAYGDSITCTATHTVTQADLDAGSVLNVATADSVETPEVSDSVTVLTPETAVDLAIAKKTTTPPTTNGAATYELTVSNNGPATASAISVTDTLPLALTYVSVAGDGWTCTLSLTGRSVTCTTAATLAKGASLPVITVTGSVNSGATGVVTNVATVTSPQRDVDPTNNQASVTNDIPVVETRVEVRTPTTTLPPVTPVTEPLAVTGSSSSGLEVLGAGLIALGLMAMFARRRRS